MNAQGFENGENLTQTFCSLYPYANSVNCPMFEAILFSF